ncbi:RNA polymerase sigma factor [Niabella ginsengisoli]|uniref:RNA polymerase sigma factor n=1 Tax=Niabella ginsengisoli TaxID=522298 RepID=A0ABS9SQE5_9BACT|nr:RNA polymerase sigma factor [Niabella ginsengisoli]MCH5600595.1 RNA polymerase sigma factor [Niabella ginsengisoli]
MTEKEYNDCVTNHADALYRFMIKSLKHSADAEDMVQSAYEVLWQNRLEIKFETAKSYLFKVAYHKMIDHFRKSNRTELYETLEYLDKGVEEKRDNLKSILEEALGRLSEQNRSLVLLKDYEGYNYEEIGEITGLNPSQVKVYLHRSRLQLKAYLVKIENLV